MNTPDQGQDNYEAPRWNLVDTSLVTASAICFAGGFVLPSLFGMSLTLASVEAFRIRGRKYQQQQKIAFGMIEDAYKKATEYENNSQ